MKVLMHELVCLLFVENIQIDINGQCIDKIDTLSHDQSNQMNFDAKKGI